MKSQVGVDGKTEYIFHQSTINNAMMCLEQARLGMEGQLVDVTTDAAAIGTATHAGIEFVLKGGTYAEGVLEVEAAYLRAEESGIRYVQSRGTKTAIGKAVKCYAAWYNHVFPCLPIMELVEAPFEVPMWEGPDSRILLRGTIDAVDEFGELWDWKTANQPYELWQLQRYKVQPTVYTYAWAYCTSTLDLEHTFNYAVMYKTSKTPQILAVTRDSGHWDWLHQQCRSLIALMGANLQLWPLNDQGWHCSPKWCGAYAECKGKFVSM